LTWRWSALSLLWWAGISIAFLQFYIPYSQGDTATAYQNGFPTTPDPGELLINVQAFLWQSFPLGLLSASFADLLQSPHLALGLLLSSLVLGTLVWWQRQHNEPLELPSVVAVLGALVGGLLMTMAAGLVYAYVQLLTYRSHYFAAPAETIAFVCFWVLIIRLLIWVLRVKPSYAIGVATVLYFTLGTTWYYQHQMKINTTLWADFSERMVVFRQLQALIPEVVPTTLIAYHCNRHPTDLYHNPISDVYGVRLLYQDRAAFQSTNNIVFTTDRAFVDLIYGNLIGPKFPTEYTYDQMILVGCTDEGLFIHETLPPEINGDTALYQPKARIVATLLQDWQQRMLAR
jgi:hypothetical protein